MTKSANDITISVESIAAIFESGIKNKRFQENRRPLLPGGGASTASSMRFCFSGSTMPERHPYPEDPDTILDIFFRGLIDAVISLPGFAD